VLFTSPATVSEFDEPWVAFTKFNDPRHATQEIAEAVQRRILVASNICLADHTDEDCRQREEAALTHGVTMLKGDFPAPVEDREYWFDFPDQATARCNPLTAPDICTSEALEHL
jgi:hypothetical protein